MRLLRHSPRSARNTAPARSAGVTDNLIVVKEFRELMTTTTAPTPNEKWAPRFFTLWTGQALSLLGSQLVQFAIIWHLTRTTNSATTLAIASLMGLLPQVILSPFIGTWVDRGNRRLILISADATVALATLVLVVLFALGRAELWHIYGLLFIRAVAGGFHQSA